LRGKHFPSFEQLRNAVLLEEGLERGRIEGLNEGLIEGRLEGLNEGRIEIARNLKSDGFSVEIIARILATQRKRALSISPPIIPTATAAIITIS